MARSLKIAKTVKNAEGSAQETSTVKVGKIGATALAGNQLQIRFKTGGTEYTGWISKQVGARRFKCTDGTRTAICSLVNKANNSLANNDMTLLATKADASTFRVQKVTNKRATDFSGNVYAWNFTSADALSVPLETVVLASA